MTDTIEAVALAEQAARETCENWEVHSFGMGNATGANRMIRLLAAKWSFCLQSTRGSVRFRLCTNLALLLALWYLGWAAAARDAERSLQYSRLRGAQHEVPALLGQRFLM